MGGVNFTHDLLPNLLGTYLVGRNDSLKDFLVVEYPERWCKSLFAGPVLFRFCYLLLQAIP